MNYIIDKSIITNLANDGCIKYSVNLIDQKWKKLLRKQLCDCGSGKKRANCCYILEQSRNTIKDYNFVEEHLSVKIPHPDKAPLITHMRAGEFAEIRKIEELSYYYSIGTNIKVNDDQCADDELKQSLSSFYNEHEVLNINFHRGNFEELGRLIYERKIKGKDFRIGTINGDFEFDDDIGDDDEYLFEDKGIAPQEFKKIVKSNKYDYLYQLKFSVKDNFFCSLIADIDTSGLYDFSKIKFSNYIPDFVKVVSKDNQEYLNCKVFDKNLNVQISRNEKTKLVVADIKNSEFSNKFFIELGLYMIALNSFIWDNDCLSEDFEVVAGGLIYPEHDDELEQERYYRIKNGTSEQIKTWKVDFATVREELISVFRKKLPNLIQIIENGKNEEYNEIKIASMCTTCDYYGGQHSKELKNYIDKQKMDNPTFNYQDIEEYLNAPENNFCRYCVKNLKNINVLPDLDRGEKNTLLKQSIKVLDDLENAITSEHEIFNYNKTLKADIKVLENSITLRKNDENYKIINDRTINLPRFSNVKIFIDIQKSTKEQTLSFAYGLNYFHRDLNGNITKIDISNAEFSISITDEYSFRNDLREYFEFLFKINDLLKRYEDVSDQYGNNLSYSIIYWGQSTYDHLKKLFLNIFDFIKRDGNGIETIYTTIPTSVLNEKKRKVRELKERFYTLFAPEDEVQDYRVVEKSPFFDMKKAITDLMVLNADINLTLQQVNSLITGYNSIFKYHKPDSDSFNGYVFGQIWASEQLDGDSRDDFKNQIKSIIRNRIKAMMGIYLNLSTGGYLYGVPPTIIPLQRENHFANFGMGNDLYLFYKLDNAHSLVETELIHNEEVYKKTVLGRSIFLEKLYTNQQREEILMQNDLNVNDQELFVFKISENSKEANFDEKSICLTIYPKDKAEYIFMKFVDKRYNNVIFYDSSIYNFNAFTEWRWKIGNPYKNVVEVSIEKLLRFDGIIILRISALTRRLMELLINEYQFDFTKNLVLEGFHADFWGKLLKKSLDKVSDNELARRMLEDFVNEQMNSLLRQDVRNLVTNHYLNGEIPLDDSQIDAIIHALNNKMTLLWGPPGTGKTHTVIHLLLSYYFLCKQNSNDEIKRILVMCNNYDAFDNIIRKMSSSGILDYNDVLIVRIKSKDREERDYQFNQADYWEISADTYSDEFKEDFRCLSTKPQRIQIIASTPNQIAKIFTNNSYSRNQKVRFDLVIVDEASQMDVGHFVPALLKIKENTQFVLAGDDLQLPPITNVKLINSSENYYGSIFSYYLNEFHNETTNNLRVPLHYNRRSNRIIVEYSKLAFDYDKKYEAVENSEGQIKFVSEPKNDFYDDVLDPQKVICVLNYDDGNASQINPFEADEVIKLIKRIWERGVYKYGTSNRYGILEFFDKCIGVVVPHRAQRTLIQQKLIEFFVGELKIHEVEGIEERILKDKVISCIDTVERYQGQEREIMICSYVLGDIDIIRQEEEFIYNPNRLNVMISRARFKAIVLASNELIMSISDDIDIIDIQQSLKVLVDYCKNYSEITNDSFWTERNGVIRYLSPDL